MYINPLSRGSTAEYMLDALQLIFCTFALSVFSQYYLMQSDPIYCLHKIDQLYNSLLFIRYITPTPFSTRQTQTIVISFINGSYKRKQMLFTVASLN